MRVLTLTTSYPRNEEDYFGGFVWELSNRLARTGHEVEVLAPETYPPARQPDGVRVHRFSYLPGPMQKLAYGSGIMINLRENPLLAWQAPAFVLAMKREAVRLAPRFDIIHSHWLFPGGWIGAGLQRRMGKSHLVTVHSGGYHLLRRLPHARRAFECIIGSSRAVVAVSESQKRGIAEILRAGADDELLNRIHIIPMGVDYGLMSAIPAPAPTAAGLNVLYIGRLIQMKGIGLLLDAARSLPEIRFIIAGEGPMLKTVQAAVRAGLSNVELAGVVRGRAKLALINRAHVMAVPSKPAAGGQEEGLPLALLEGMAAARAMVAARTGGIPEVLRHEQNGLLIRPGSGGEFIAALRRLQADPDLLLRLGERAREDVKGFDWDIIADRYRAIIDSWG